MNIRATHALVTPLVAGLSLALAACNQGGDGGTALASGSDNPQYAQVTHVKPIRETVKHPKQVCKDEPVTQAEAPKDQHQIAGTAIGAVVGGLAGHQVGGGKGKTLATIAGAVGGGYAGKKIQERHQANNPNTVTTTERHCETVDNPTTRTVGYEVTYQFNGQTHTTRMDHDPGDRVRVQQGVVAVSDNQ